MNWKQTLFLGGAVLVLAACADSTAPAPGLRQTKGTAAAKAKNGGSDASTPTTNGFCSSYSVSVGRADTTATCGLQ